MITIHVSPLYCIHVIRHRLSWKKVIFSPCRKTHPLSDNQAGRKQRLHYPKSCIWIHTSDYMIRAFPHHLSLQCFPNVLSTCWATSQWAMCGAGACLLQLRGQKMSCCGFFPAYCILRSFSLHRGLSITVSMPQMGGEQQLVCVLLSQDLNDSVCPCLSTCP